jgi:hypothetical protein
MLYLDSQVIRRGDLITMTITWREGWVLGFQYCLVLESAQNWFMVLQEDGTTAARHYNDHCSLVRRQGT